MGDHGLKDNVGLIAVLRAHTPAPIPAPSHLPPATDGSPTLVVANTHLLFNPKRGDIKASTSAHFMPRAPTTSPLRAASPMFKMSRPI